MIKVVFFDIDGTLVPLGKNKITESAVWAINSLQKQGIKVVICTGRHITEIGVCSNILEKIIPDGIISTTGSYCVDKEGKLFYTNPMNNVQKEKILKIFNEKKYSMELKTDFGVYANFISPLCELVKQSNGDNSRKISEYKSEEIYQGILYVDFNDRKQLEKEISELKFTSWHPQAVDLIPPNSGKTLGIEKFIEKENIDVQETMAFGDGENDIDMLQYVGLGIAMGNSDKRVKKCADYITDSCENDGIYKALKHIELI